MFIDDYSGKYVKINCKFFMVTHLPGGFSDTQYFAFWAQDSSGPPSPMSLTVIGPKRLGDLFLSLRQGDQLIVYGKAIPLSGRTVAGGRFRELALMADSIEKK